MEGLEICLPKFYTYEMTDENFDNEFPFKKFLFDFQFEGIKLFCITFDTIPSPFKLRRFIRKFSKDYNMRVKCFNIDLSLIETEHKFVRDLIKELKKERKFRKIEKDDDYKSYKVFINGKRVYNHSIVISKVRNTNILHVELDKVWDGPIAIGGWGILDDGPRKDIDKFTLFNNIRF